MKKEVLSYAAGFVDGEGCLSFAKRQSKAYYITPTVQVTNTSKEIIEWLRSTFGGSVYTVRDRRPTRKPVWLWSLAGSKAREFTRVVRPWLRVKDKQADLILSQNRFPPSTRDRKGRLVRTLSAAEKRHRASLVKQMRALNRRGATVASSCGCP